MRYPLEIMNCHDPFLSEAALVSYFVTAVFTWIKMSGMGYLIQIKKTVGPDSTDSDEYDLFTFFSFPGELLRKEAVYIIK